MTQVVPRINGVTGATGQHMGPPTSNREPSTPSPSTCLQFLAESYYTQLVGGATCLCNEGNLTFDSCQQKTEAIPC